MVEAIRRACDLGSMTTTSSATLNRRIEQLVHEHIAACRRDAQQALERAFAAASPSSKTSATGGRVAKVTTRNPPLMPKTSPAAKVRRRLEVGNAHRHCSIGAKAT